jgi:hypothetical protein
MGRLIKAMFPDRYGSVRFNVSPKNSYVNVNIEQNLFLDFEGNVIKERK